MARALHGKGKSVHPGRVVAVAVLVFAAAALVVLSVGIVFFPRFSANVIEPVSPAVAHMLYPDSARLQEGDGELTATRDADLSTTEEQGIYRAAHKGRPAVNPLVAQCNGIDLRSPVAPADLTGVLFHQSATPWAYQMTTQLEAANMEECGVSRSTRVNKDQFDEGEWLDSEAMHVWRTEADFDMDTSLDVGAAAGTVIRSPVSGTVLHLRDYTLFESVDDVEIHIQPDGHPELDVVLIHNTDPMVKAGDRVEAGVTEIARVRDIAAGLTDVQLMFYTEGDDPGNHSHVQVNDVNYPNYREQRLQ